MEEKGLAEAQEWHIDALGNKDSFDKEHNVFLWVCKVPIRGDHVEDAHNQVQVGYRKADNMEHVSQQYKLDSLLAYAWFAKPF